MLVDLVHSMGVALLFIGALLLLATIVYVIATFSVFVSLLFILFAFVTFAHFCINH